jgi:DNA-binding MarR family transcriptional regulator
VSTDPPDDAELERLLTMLLRMVRPPGAAWDRDIAVASASAADVAGAEGGTAAEAAATSKATGAAAEAAGTSNGAAAGFPAVSESEARALAELVSARGISQGSLASLLGLEKSTVSRLAAGLERKGLVRRGRDEDNQRYVRLYLTPEGRAVALRVWNVWHSRQARMLAALSAEERAGLSAGLRGLFRSLVAEGLLSGPEPGSPG